MERSNPPDPERERLVKEYRLIFDSVPLLKELALGYWKEVERLEDNPNAISLEEELFDCTVINIANILLDDTTFMKAMRQEGTDPINNAIIESFYMLEVVLDIENSNG